MKYLAYKNSLRKKKAALLGSPASSLEDLFYN